MMNAEHPIWAANYDAFSLPLESLGIRRQRVRIAEDAHGRVLDLGIGTGLSLPFYTRADEVVGVDPDPTCSSGHSAARGAWPARFG
jgi:hypothetical protein